MAITGNPIINPDMVRVAGSMSLTNSFAKIIQKDQIIMAPNTNKLPVVIEILSTAKLKKIIDKTPSITKIVPNIFLAVSFSFNQKWAKIKTKKG